MTIYEIDHIQLAMPAGQEEKARAFYTGVLGFTEFPKPDMLANRGGAWFFSATVKIHLGIDANFHAARKAHPAFLVDNLDVMLLKLKQAGIEFDALNRRWMVINVSTSSTPLEIGSN